jgi:hypothetical protein
MPKVSRETASETIALEGLDVQLEHLDGGYSVCFESHTAAADLADLFRGLPDDRCQLPSGSRTARRPTRRATPTTSRPATRPSTTRGLRSSNLARRISSRRRSPW